MANAQMADAVLEIIVLKTTMHSNGKCTLRKNNACLNMIHI
jgi:hypothetical protein